jgi:membrane protease YdiL (CAAX protease family)
MQHTSPGWRSRGCVSYVGLAFLFTWSLLPVAATSIAVSLVALCGPAVAALVVTAGGSREERQHFFTRVTDWRIAPPWYLVALLLPLPITAFRSGLEYALGARGGVELQAISALGVVVFFLVAGEEIGWRGFALPRLLPRFGPLGASAVVGIVWAFWHLPLFYIPAMPQFGTPFPAFIVYTIALSVLLTFLALQSRGSVVIATLFHGAVNTIGVVNTAAGPSLRGWSNALSYGVAALLVVASWERSRRMGREE